MSGDGLVVVASEAGAVPLPDGVPVRRGRLGPGQLLAIDPRHGLRFDGELTRDLASRKPYAGWVEESLRFGEQGEPAPVPDGGLAARHALHGYTREELSLMLRPIAQSGQEPVYSMGDDAPIAPLAGRARPFASYFRQRFAQVTNPAIDHYRERTVMSIATLVGVRPPLGVEGPLAAARRAPVVPRHARWARRARARGRGRHVRCCRGPLGRGRARRRRGGRARRGGRHGRVPERRRRGRDRAAIPSLLAVAATHGRLTERGHRTDCSILVSSDEARDTHMVATLLGYGADVICPRLALETVAHLAAIDKVGGDRPTPDEAQRRLLRAFEDGVLKVMSKLGISDVASYRGARLFEAVGLDRRLCRRFFGGTPSAIGGIGLDRLEQDALDRLAMSESEKPELENPGFYKFRKGGEPHATDPDVVEALQEGMTAAHALVKAVKGERFELYERFAALVNDRTPLEPRDLLELVPARAPMALEDVEPVESIVRRFSGGAMSHGALSAEAHETIAIAFNRLGGRSNSGEGGEDRERYRDERNSKIKQVASGRFGVTAEYAAFAEELQIKIAQGSKPGEGGQIPAHKVTGEIARLRSTTPGVSLISPPPHHDIYSIEDLAQLVFDLREVNPDADVSVKLVASSGVGLIAAGVAKAHADVVHIAGADGGTGASPLASIKHAGAPWELGLAETQQALVGERPSRPRARARRRRHEDRPRRRSWPRCSEPTSTRSARRSFSPRGA